MLIWYIGSFNSNEQFQKKRHTLNGNISERIETAQLQIISKEKGGKKEMP